MYAAEREGRPRDGPSCAWGGRGRPFQASPFTGILDSQGTPVWHSPHP
jgi:hypothetical protein